ncbi:MAG: DsrE/DsrF/DrsH-like family protein [Nitrososphaerota archaeon]|jgi:peroxiredoxin family protein|nr:DsrE/DsrF/DrsH-like family protein [Nitrososphaerota archaeon]MCL5672785.1 DsrE/DsrF/DrsH-like family protein [Nitrososphaerota archaeon]MDG6912194.1 DsrE/DsrF/DrsH-like family protein [Nitrososphaerota archaeon]MDG6936965.1 DsrE/DsrF/DrsH-like family protein [Nitrososphaerota archaeon]MDG6945420.1 DsrE/DsrF/DrsH-like family protein [Nitrososphaerota archaeon]
MSQVTSLRTEEEEEQTERMLIILSKGSMDMAYPALMIATTAATMGKEVHMFFTFWGLQAVSKKSVGSLKVSPVGNPGMPMPNILGMIPGMTAMATRMMGGKMKKAKVPSIPDMLKMAKDLGVKLHACSTTMEVMGVSREALVDEIDDVVGAATMVSLGEGGQTIFI